MTEFEVGTRLIMAGHKVEVAPHPGAPELPYAQEGRIATVYQLREAATGLRYALKVYRDASTFQRVIASGDLLHSIERPGLSAAAFERVEGPVTKQWPALKSAILMPWIEGSTWQDVIVTSQDYPAPFLLGVARQLAATLSWLESRGMTHGDLCGANLLLQATRGTSGPAVIELVDLDQVSDSGSQSTMTIAAGSPGYVPDAFDFANYRMFADRCAGAILMAEILGWAYQDVRSASDAESYFARSEVLKPSQRLEVMLNALDRVDPALKLLMNRLWEADRASSWPRLAEWSEAIQGIQTSAVDAGTTGRKGRPVEPDQGPREDGVWEKQMLSSWQAKTLGETRAQGLGYRVLAFAIVGVAAAFLILVSGLLGFAPLASLGPPLGYALSVAALAVVASGLNVWFYRRAFGSAEVYQIGSKAAASAGLAAFIGGMFSENSLVLAGVLIGVMAGCAVGAILVLASTNRREYRFGLTALTWIGSWTASALAGSAGSGSVVEVLIVLGGIGGLTALLVGLTPDIEF